MTPALNAVPSICFLGALSQLCKQLALGVRQGEGDPGRGGQGALVPFGLTHSSSPAYLHSGLGLTHLPVAGNARSAAKGTVCTDGGPEGAKLPYKPLLTLPLPSPANHLFHKHLLSTYGMVSAENRIM